MDPLADARVALAEGRHRSARRLAEAAPASAERDELLAAIADFEALSGPGPRDISPPPPRDRPLGVSVLAVLTLLNGALGVAIGLFALAVGVGLGLVVLLMGAGFVATARGLWRLRPWAWWVGVTLSVVNVVFDVATLWSGPGAVLSLVLSLVTLAYLVAVKDRFHAPSESPHPNL